MTARPRVSLHQRHILTRIAEGWQLCSDGRASCWLQTTGNIIPSFEEISMRTAERLVLRHLVHPAGHLLPDGWRAIGRIKTEAV